MSDNKFKVEIGSQPARRVIGLKVRTNMANAFSDCSGLWQNSFGPRMTEVASFPSESYGISVMAGPDEFDYWAALSYRDGDPVPKNMLTMDLPGGDFAVLALDSLEDLAAGYQYLFSSWMPESNYDYRMEAFSYELYPANHMETGKLTLYMPVRLKDN